MPDNGSIHLRPTAQLADRVLLPGDPHRALAVAQEVLEEPKMFNHTRGLWGYTGTAPDGELLTVQATGMGGPSAAIVIEELIGLGARTLVRIGTCGALDDTFELGALVAGRAALAADGTSAVLLGENGTGASAGAPASIPADPAITEALVDAGAREATVVSTDLFYDARAHVMDEWLAAGATVVEMEAATLLALARRDGVAAGVVLAVTDLLASGARERIDAERLTEVGTALGRAGWAALGAAR